MIWNSSDWSKSNKFLAVGLMLLVAFTFIPQREYGVVFLLMGMIWVFFARQEAKEQAAARHWAQLTPEQQLAHRTNEKIEKLQQQLKDKIHMAGIYTSNDKPSMAAICLGEAEEIKSELRRLSA